MVCQSVTNKGHGGDSDNAYTIGYRRNVSTHELQSKDRRQLQMRTVDDCTKIFHVLDVIVIGAARRPDLIEDLLP